MIDIQTLFGNVALSTFVDEYLHRLPFSLPASAASFCELGTWEALGTILSAAGDDAHVMREGQWQDAPAPRDADAARALCRDGCTIFVRHAERHHPGLADLAAAFEATFLGPVNIHVFATPAGAPGFSWHYDAEDVFILQTAGAKEYSLRKNTVNPWPLEETLPADMQYERELMPLLRVLLQAGDMLYIPCGYWHKAEAKDAGETAISLAVGVMSRTAIDVYDFLRARLVDSLVWRQRLPLPGPPSARSPEELEAAYQQLFAQLSKDLSRTLAEPTLVAEFLDQFGRHPAHA